jgi:2-oxo-3-hexenedioate decarboxylase
MSTLDKSTIAQLAEHLENAEINVHDVKKITNEYPNMDWDDAYDIQWEIRRRKVERGHRIVGLKMGLTSYAKMKQMGVETAIYAFLADYFSVSDGASINTKELIHPKVEAEIAVITGKDLQGPGCTVAHVLDAISSVVPAVEIIDSRYENFNFDLKSVIADNASSARFVTGGNVKKPEQIDMKTLGVVMEKNGEIVELGAGASVLGHPAASVAMLANMLAERGEIIPAGTFVMTGGITAAVAVESGDSICVKYQELGSINIRFE